MLEIRNQSDLTENHIKIKVAEIQRLSSNWLWLLMAAYKPSLTYAKILKYISQYLIRRDLSRDFTEIMQAFPNVL